MGANELYRKYKKEGGQLSFAEFMTREKKKNFVGFDGSATIPTNKPLTDSISKTLDNIHRQAGLKTDLENKYIFGINRNVLIVTGIVAVGITAFVIYKKMKK